MCKVQEIYYAERIFDKSFRFIFKMLAMKKSFPHSAVKEFYLDKKII